MEAAERKFFPKNARLSFKNDIDSLFEKGQSFISYPLRIVYLSDTGDCSQESDISVLGSAPESVTNLQITSRAASTGISVLVSVPKKRIKRAVKRNRIKRLIRESFRLNKDNLTDINELNGKSLHIAFLYVCDDVLQYSEIEKAMIKALKKIRTNSSATIKQ